MAAVDDYRGYFAVDNGESTFDLCSLKNGNLIKSFTFRSREVDCRLPLQVAFVGDGRFIAGGSDHGVAYVYERKECERPSTCSTMRCTTTRLYKQSRYVLRSASDPELTAKC